MAWSETDFMLTCATSGVEHAVSVTTPFRYDALESAPLILCLDGAWTAGTVRDGTRIMSMSSEAPEAIVASLSFTDDTMSSYLQSRARWFCPTQWVPPEITGVKGVTAEDMGQAMTYLAFIRDQVMPRLEADFRVGERWLVGHSFSALFGLQTLFSEPNLFDKYLLASPSIWWHDRVMLDIEADYVADHDDLAAQVFLTAGEEEDALDDEFNMCGNVIEMATRLSERGYPSLQLSHALLPTESHSSTIGAAISRGLRHLQ
jgi:predicted alpha/beta superfamily hydrolase